MRKRLISFVLTLALLLVSVVIKAQTSTVYLDIDFEDCTEGSGNVPAGWNNQDYTAGTSTLPTLPATTLADNCYQQMFMDCTSLVVNTEAPGAEWSIPAGASVGSDATNNMFANTGGSFTGAPQPGTTYYIASAPAPAPANYLCFTANTANSTIELTKSGSSTAVTIQYQVNGTAEGGWGNGFYGASTTDAADKASNLGFKKSDN